MFLQLEVVGTSQLRGINNDLAVINDPEGFLPRSIFKLWQDTLFMVSPCGINLMR